MQHTGELSDEVVEIAEQQKQEEKQKIEEKQKFLEFRLKINKLKNLVLEKVESLQSPSILSIDIDNMDGLDFEHYVADLLYKQGFETEVTKGSGDLGVDIIAANYDGKYAVQVKRYNQPVSRRAISDAVAGKSYYKCDLAMVITNNYFTKDAIKLAKSSGCLLVDRDKLIQWIKDYTSESKDYKQLLVEEIEELQHSNYYWGEDVVFKVSKELIQEFNLDMGKQYEKYYIQEKNDINKIYSYQSKSQSKSEYYVLPPTDFLA
ncbi:MAG: restriction endonuclease, partial [Acidobacteriota bacterium]|nr:restriction endonuclease [Acidobacteriota bacterium]